MGAEREDQVPGAVEEYVAGAQILAFILVAKGRR